MEDPHIGGVARLPSCFIVDGEAVKHGFSGSFGGLERMNGGSRELRSDASRDNNGLGPSGVAHRGVWVPLGILGFRFWGVAAFV